MHTHNGTLYPMLGVGAFMTMFWTGVVLGYELGLGCVSMLITGLLCGCIATVGVCELQRRDAQGFVTDPRAPRPATAGPSGRVAAHEPARPGEGRPRPEPVGIGARLPIGPC